MSLSSNSTNFTLTIPPQGTFKIWAQARASTYYCISCDNTGFETYVVKGQQGVTRCPDCVNRERGFPIPLSEIGVS